MLKSKRYRCAYMALTMILTCVASTTTYAQTTILRVDSQSTATSPDGSTWALAYPFLQDALTACDGISGNKEIRVRGTSGGLAYKPDRDANHPSGTGVRATSFVLRLHVLMIGQFVGGTGGNADTVDLSLLSILDGEIGSAGYSDNSYHVVRAGNSSMTADNTLCAGFTIRNGNGNGGDQFDDNGGGGVYVDGGAAPRFDRCIITANRAGVGLTPEDEEQALIPTARAWTALIPRRCSPVARFHPTRTMPAPASMAAACALRRAGRCN